ncbi:ATP-binding protein [Lentimicrobium sp.]|jgi:signal transduction histidine kinase|uniref:sensor histidine kinase n=1 Tax=Lentimicrobium sp. TaxID=2034841 RepID=UPI0025E7D2BC|nr:ATP-binding protein [Lentimicrobium sp.]MCO5255542.1 histidine kinase [Lentimicrobium sp.]MCO5263795.1 histidine kinase [Lentimicrobium sp.]HOP12910.1 histidine kinase [Lentimicrobium sp.]HPF63939.1 histidine kinase [Lentimicrobium sp.]HPJ61655.1 histidine kinase [Lentimicrobium sp.]
MTLKIALILSFVLQFVAATIALSLTKRTRTNIAWWLISFGFLLMAIRRIFEFFQISDSESRLITGMLSTWTGVLISVLMLGSLIFIKRIFNIQKRMDDLRKANESRVLSAIVRTEENERLNFAKELHDGLGPLLSSVKMAVSSAHTGNNGPQNKEVMIHAEKLIDESITSLKEISNKLSPHVLNNFGIKKAVKSFITHVPPVEDLNINFETNLAEKRYPYNTEVVLYRVICELITNSLKHAEARNIYITLMDEADGIRLDYLDDGIGFDSKILEIGDKGMGFANIRSRIKSLNGTIDIYTVPNEGVRVNVKIGKS